MSTVSFLAQPDWNSLTIEWFPMIFDLNGFKFRTNRPFIRRIFLNRFRVLFNGFALLFLETSFLIVAF